MSCRSNLKENFRVFPFLPPICLPRNRDMSLIGVESVACLQQWTVLKNFSAMLLLLQSCLFNEFAVPGQAQYCDECGFSRAFSQLYRGIWISRAYSQLCRQSVESPHTSRTTVPKFSDTFFKHSFVIRFPHPLHFYN